MAGQAPSRHASTYVKIESEKVLLMLILILSDKTRPDTQHKKYRTVGQGQ